MKEFELSQEERRLLQKKDRRIFNKAIITYLRLVFSYVLRISGDINVAQDLSQDTFVKAWKNIQKYDPTRDFKPWLMRIAHNVANDYFRKRKDVPLSELSENESLSYEESTSDGGLEFELSRKEESEKVLQALARLSTIEREILVLHYMEDFSIPQISQILDIPEETARTRLKRARKSFSVTFEPESPSNSVLDSDG